MLVNPLDVELSGTLGAACQRAVQRLAKPPYTVEWLRADLSFEKKRPFTNYSGDVSGRFIEVASLTSPPGRLEPATLGELLKTFAQFQQPDGHFGKNVKWGARGWAKPGNPILWGNARMLVGLVSAYQKDHDARLLASARRLGDFCLRTADMLCDPAREAEFRATGTYADGYVTCYFPAIEGLVMLQRATGDRRYLDLAERMAETFVRYDALPIDHAHGNLCAQVGLLLLYEETGRSVYLERVVAKWNAAVKGGYVWPTGGVGEKFRVAYVRDEGCAEADWLRLNLDLWRLTGQTRYLEMAERLLHNHLLADQFASGGFGHREIELDERGPTALLKRSEEATWCCCFHGVLGLERLKTYLAVGAPSGIYLNFPLDFSAPVKVGAQRWRVTARTVEPHDGDVLRWRVRVEPLGDKAARTHLFVRVPEWAERVEVYDRAGRSVSVTQANGYLQTREAVEGKAEFELAYRGGLRIEDRRFGSPALAGGAAQRLHDVVIREGPNLLFARGAPARPVLLATTDHQGRPRVLFQDGKDHGAVVRLPDVNATEQQLGEALNKPEWVALEPLGPTPDENGRFAFVYDLVIVAPDSKAGRALGKLAERDGELHGTRKQGNR